ncbi:MAG: hypothetical protein UW30_C0009G0002 [Candidatus Giovannonibacteria bacterium GW2011_GWA2_44_13b]|uniref:Nucleotidyltransferase family protein n=2 Tax=Candidatus Giovannoniibacteriota TaxID=1752738 RepID=A0A0G1JBC5_9BACT|nr:MAG: hypothetical protein UW30_C0009G0002 [Candidatus Giovannonibacteria bacterium GW2011_GWA2_44_13b]
MPGPVKFLSGNKMDELKILKLIEDDSWMMSVLRAAESMELPDWMIGAGFVRNKVWNHLHGYKNSEVPTADIDLIYFNPSDISEEKEKELDRLLKKKMDANWSAKNQARMHIKHDKEAPYKNSEEALSEWVETCTCVAVRLEKDSALKLFAPHGIADLVNLVVRPVPAFMDNPERFWARIKNKEWEKKWPKLIIKTK